MPKLTWKKLKARFPNLPADQKVSLVRSLDSGHEQAVFKGLMPLGDEIMEPLAAAVKKVEGLGTYFVTQAYEPGLYAILLHERGEQPPESIDHFLASCFRHAALSRERLGPALLALPEARRRGVAWRMTDDYNPRESTTSICQALGPELAFHGLMQRLDQKKARYYDANSERQYIQAFHAIGAPRWALATALVRGKCSTRVARLLLHAAKDGATEPNGPELIVALLGFGNKGVRAEAFKQTQALLADHGEALKPALEAGLETRKKTQRAACAELLKQLEGGGPEAPELPEILSKAMAEADSVTVRTALKRGGGVALFAEREHCTLQGSSWEWEKRLRDAGAGEAAAWAAVYLFAELPSGGKRWALNRFRDAMSHLYKAEMVPALRWALTAREPAHAGPLYELLAQHEGAEVDPAVWLPALESASKTARELAVQQLAKAPASLAPQLMQLLKSRRRATREAAAQLLVQHPPEDAAALQAALDKEEVMEVAQHLRAALAALSPAEAEAPKALNEAALLERLRGVRKKRAPKWLDLDALPELKLVSGEILVDRALSGLLALLSLEGPDHHDTELAAAAALVEPSSAAAWSLAVLDAWAAAAKKKPSWRVGRRDALTGPASHKWAVFQQALFIDEARVEALRAFLAGPMASSNHHYVSWSLKVLERRGTPLAEDVLIGRAVLADRETELNQARAILATLAERKGASPIDLVRAATVCAPQVQHSPNASTPDPVKRTVLERQMGSRARWSAAQVSTFLLGAGAYAAVARAVIFRVSDGALVRPEGASLITIDGSPRPLAEGETLGVPHVLELENHEIDAWQAQLDAAGLTQPFEQLQRPYRLAANDSFERSEGIPRGRFEEAAEAAGWDLSERDGYGANTVARLRFLARGVKVRLHHSAIGPWLKDPVDTHSLLFKDLLDQELAPEDVDPVAYSEALIAAERCG